MTPPVPDSAVEALARAEYGDEQPPWEKLGEAERDELLAIARRGLTAALPSLREQVLAEVREKLLGGEFIEELLSQLEAEGWEVTFSGTEGFAQDARPAVETALDHAFPTQQEAPRG